MGEAFGAEPYRAAQEEQPQPKAQQVDSQSKVIPWDCNSSKEFYQFLTDRKAGVQVCEHCGYPFGEHGWQDCKCANPWRSGGRDLGTKFFSKQADEWWRKRHGS